MEKTHVRPQVNDEIKKLARHENNELVYGKAKDEEIREDHEHQHCGESHKLAAAKDGLKEVKETAEKEYHLWKMTLLAPENGLRTSQ
mmetsp:Transcript_27268/g.46693  ORF Transcript_27268/g.46693 Transcript_27268/m.46693 type:complete len:87 (+) Transcript_27268:933-1193(+)|eukprot:CAMPEP_0206153914 /NCGR_PEP_ID=MMETSP1474-20131121/983_1 /ASSEMBLY_ACC=CAM_ASM_001110 /TAXON_ID=97495 /ORGANISM="Imantonia sp., Strain RCC918" /LENGTH=86 /DNA_ID=CAMNT_0053551913 /DNA_START=912 /DNA_END=1172 /DNA_ORIENTATION=+